MDTARPGEREQSLLVVHGRDFKPGPDPLYELATAAFRAGLERDYPDCMDRFDALTVRLAYYGDLTNALLEGRGRHYDEAVDIGDRANVLHTLKAVSARKRFGIRQYDNLPGKSAVPEFIADVGAPVLGALGLTMRAIRWLSIDFHEYLRGMTHYASQVRSRVRTELCALLDSGSRVMLVAHGTGAVVAYDVLWQLSHDERFAPDYGPRKVDTFVTLGAPLGNASIRRRLLATRDATQPDFPANVLYWHNVSAEDDYTCHDNTLADDFRRMMQERMVSAVHDYRIYNLAVRFGRSNPHSSLGYYIHPRMSKILADWLLTEPVGLVA
ncbi:MAG: hypothetical protein R3176_09490 [Woeseiaceae bacterium]|nr:hypothetical protein [Woeseiaceae bacterium]